MGDGSALPGNTAPLHLDHRVIFAGALGGYKRLVYYPLMLQRRESLFIGRSIDIMAPFPVMSFTLATAVFLRPVP